MSFQPRQIKSRTVAGRLSALDAYLAKFERELLLRDSDQVVVDLGFGEWPLTTMEMAKRFWTVNPELRIVGTESEPRRVEQALPTASSHLDFRIGTELPETVPEPIRMIRAMNVLRGYPKAYALTALTAWGDALAEQGVLIEGTSDAKGNILTAHVFRKTDGVLVQELLLFYTNFERGFAPWMFRDHLPVDLRRDVRPGTWIHHLFTRWHEAWLDQRNSNLSAPDVFKKSVGLILPNQDPWLTEHGYVLWRHASISRDCSQPWDP